ncbi:hypothetical protein EDB86DRAFT_2293950 [Lactarius hatsudake]|nr:hypothetical protein EDB86DRAFT_2293950 [Lactarius hatsudake]
MMNGARLLSLARFSSPTSSTLLTGSKCRPVSIPTDGPFHATRNRLLLSEHRHGDRFPKHAPPSQLLRLLRMFSFYSYFTSSTTTLSNRMSTAGVSGPFSLKFPRKRCY